MKPSHAAMIAGAALCVAAGPVLADLAAEFNRRAADRDVATFKALDRDGDGRLTFEEVYGSVDMQARFKDMDVDGNGAVTAAELAHYVRQRYGVDLPPASDAARQPGNTGSASTAPMRPAQ